MKHKRQTIHKAAEFKQRLLCVAVASAFGSAAYANPTGPQVVSGQASFAAQGNTLSIVNSPNAIINWQSFSIGAPETTQFLQQSVSSAVLNRVVGIDPSIILGTLQSNGKVFLINPSGVLFGKGSRIDVAGLVASTLNMSDQDFLAGRLNFATGSIHAGAVTNQGTITTPSGGSVILVAPQVENSGIINAPNGDVILAAGRSVRLGDTGAPNVLVEIQAPDNQAINVGEIVVGGGSASIYAGLISQQGVVRADSVSVNEAGRIVFKATKDVTLAAGSLTSANGVSGGHILVQAGEGTNLVYGVVEAKGLPLPPGEGRGEGKGGGIQLLGAQVGVAGEAHVDASGSAGGGTILVGGDYKGGNSAIQNARATYFGAEANLVADATDAGNGGRIVLWSDEVTRAYGKISAKGGATSGDGGFVETSSRGYLEVTAAPDLTAPNGVGGTWLIDPWDIIIDNSTQFIRSTGIDPITYLSDETNTPATTPSHLGADTVSSALNGGTSVIVDTSGSGTQGGNISVEAQIQKTDGGDASLTLKAHKNIYMIDGSGIDSSFGALHVTLTADQDGVGGGAVKLEGTSIDTNGGNLVIGGGADPLTGFASAAADGTYGDLNSGVWMFAVGIETGAGDITINGAANAASGLVGDGVSLGDGTYITTTTGNISINGTAADLSGDVSFASGVRINFNAGGFGGQISSETGTISITGTGAGTPSAPATSGTTGIVLQQDALVRVTGTGRIELEGTGGTSSASAEAVEGVMLLDRANILADDSGVISITGRIGVAGGGSIQNGIGMNSNGSDPGVKVRAGGDGGSITLTGLPATGGTVIENANGVAMQGAGTLVEATGNATITINGTGSDTSIVDGFAGTHGLLMFGGAHIKSAAGLISITGVAGLTTDTASGATGIALFDSGTAITTVDGVIDITGTGGGTLENPTGQSAHGVQIGNGAVIEATGVGIVNISGTAGVVNGILVSDFGRFTTGDVYAGFSDGVQVFGGSQISTVSGDLTIIGEGAAMFNDALGTNGVLIANASVQSQTGHISITGTGGGTDDGNHPEWRSGGDTLGVLLFDHATVSTGGTGTVQLEGSGGATSGGISIGVSVYNDSQVVAHDGAIMLDGTGGHSTNTFTGRDSFANHGVEVGSDTDSGFSSQVRTTGNGSILIQGVAGNAEGGANIGVTLRENTLVESGGTGSVTLDGTLTTAAYDDEASPIVGNGQNGGVSISAASIVRTGADLIESGGGITITGLGPVDGTGASLTPQLFGVRISGGSLVESVAGGIINISGDVRDARTAGLEGVGVVGSTISGGAADINITGAGGATRIDADGVFIVTQVEPDGEGGFNPVATSLVETTSGAITIIGTSANLAGAQNVSGVTVYGYGGVGSAVRSATGTISMTGTGPGDSEVRALSDNQGVVVGDGAVVETGGTLVITGYGGAATGGRLNGVLVETGGHVSGESISITGYAGDPGSDSTNSSGVAITGGSFVDVSDDTLSIIGFGAGWALGGGTPDLDAAAGGRSAGVYIGGSSTVGAFGTGNVSLRGDAGAVNGFVEPDLGLLGDSSGVTVDSGGNVFTDSGLLSIEGNGGVYDSGVPGGAGVSIIGATVATNIGAIQITGNGPTGGSSDLSGVYIGPSGFVTDSDSSGISSISIVGRAGAVSSGQSSGIVIDGGVVFSGLGAGSVILSGTGATSDNSDVGAKNHFNDGVVIFNGGSVAVNGDTTLRIDGEAGNSLGGSNVGVVIATGGSVRGENGLVMVTGIGGTGGEFNDGVFIGDGFGELGTTGSGAIQVIGTAGLDGDNLPAGRGVTLGAGGSLNSNTGSISITGITGSISGSEFVGVMLETSSVIDTGGGNVTISAPDGSIEGSGFIDASGEQTFSDGAIVDGGDVTLTAQGNINLAGANIYANADPNFGGGVDGDGPAGQGGNITLTATAGFVVLLNSISALGGTTSGGDAGKGGNVVINAGTTVEIGAIGSSGGDAITAASGGAGGSVTIEAGGALTLGSISAYGGVANNSDIGGGNGGEGGAVVLNSAGTVSVVEIDNQGGIGYGLFTGGKGGDVTVTGVGQIEAGSIRSQGGYGEAGYEGEGAHGGSGGTVSIVLSGGGFIGVDSIDAYGGLGGQGFNVSTGNSGDAGNGGNGGSVDVSNGGDGDILISGYIDVSAGSGGDAGGVGISGAGGTGGIVEITGAGSGVIEVPAVLAYGGDAGSGNVDSEAGGGGGGSVTIAGGGEITLGPVYVYGGAGVISGSIGTDSGAGGLVSISGTGILALDLIDASGGNGGGNGDNNQVGGNGGTGGTVTITGVGADAATVAGLNIFTSGGQGGPGSEENGAGGTGGSIRIVRSQPGDLIVGGFLSATGGFGDSEGGAGGSVFISSVSGALQDQISSGTAGGLTLDGVEIEVAGGSSSFDSGAQGVANLQAGDGGITQPDQESQIAGFVIDTTDLRIVTSGSVTLEHPANVIPGLWGGIGGNLSVTTGGSIQLGLLFPRDVAVPGSLSAGGDILVNATDVEGDPGDITVAAAIIKSEGSAATLTLNADNNIFVSQPVTAINETDLNVVLDSGRVSTEGRVYMQYNVATPGELALDTGSGSFTADNVSFANGGTFRIGGDFFVSGNADLSANVALELNGASSQVLGTMTLSPNAGGFVSLKGTGSLAVDTFDVNGPGVSIIDALPVNVLTDSYIDTAQIQLDNGAVLTEESNVYIDGSTRIISLNGAGSQFVIGPGGDVTAFGVEADTSIEVELQNHGSLYVSDGTVTLSGGGTSDGTLQTSANGLLVFDSTQFDITGGDVTGGTFEFASGTTTLDATATYDVSETIVSGGTFVIDGSASTFFGLSMTSGAIQGSGSLSVNNTFDATGGAIEMDLASSTLSISQSSGPLELAIPIQAHTVSLHTSEGSIVDGNGAANNITAQTLSMTSFARIGTYETDPETGEVIEDDPIETSVSEISAEAGSSGGSVVNIANFGDVFINRLSSEGGTIRFINDGQIDLPLNCPDGCIPTVDTAGGSVHIESTSDSIFVDGEINASGDAAGNLNGGTITLAAFGSIDAGENGAVSTNGADAGLGTGGFGGRINLVAGGDISVIAALQASGGAGEIIFGGASNAGSGGDGGTVYVNAPNGNVTLGAVNLNGGLGSQAYPEINQGSGNGGHGGALDVVASGDISADVINASGGNSGFSGGFFSGGGGAGGSVSLSTEIAATINVGTLNVRGGDIGGAGGSVDIVGAGSSLIVQLGLVDASGADGVFGGAGGNLAIVSSGDLDLSGDTTILTRGGDGATGISGLGGNGGNGGGIILQGMGDLNVSGTFDASGGNGGAGTGDALGGSGGAVTFSTISLPLFRAGITSVPSASPGALYLGTTTIDVARGLSGTSLAPTGFHGLVDFYAGDGGINQTGPLSVNEGDFRVLSSGNVVLNNPANSLAGIWGDIGGELFVTSMRPLELGYRAPSGFSAPGSLTVGGNLVARSEVGSEITVPECASGVDSCLYVHADVFAGGSVSLYANDLYIAPSETDPYPGTVSTALGDPLVNYVLWAPSTQGTNVTLDELADIGSFIQSPRLIFGDPDPLNPGAIGTLDWTAFIATSGELGPIQKIEAYATDINFQGSFGEFFNGNYLTTSVEFKAANDLNVGGESFSHIALADGRNLSLVADADLSGAGDLHIGGPGSAGVHIEIVDQEGLTETMTLSGFNVILNDGGNGTSGNIFQLGAGGVQNVTAGNNIEIMSSAEWVTLATDGQQNLNANGNILVQNGTSFGSRAEVHAGTRQTIEATSVTVHGASNDEFGLGALIDSDGDQSITAGELLVNAAGGNAAIRGGMFWNGSAWQENGSQVILLDGAGANALEIRGGLGTATIEGANQSIIAGTGTNAGSITVEGSAFNFGGAWIFAQAGTQEISTTGFLSVIAGSAPDIGQSEFNCGPAACALIGYLGAGGDPSTPAQSISALGGLWIEGGADGLYNEAAIFTRGSQFVYAPGGITLKGGSAGFGNYAFLGPDRAGYSQYVDFGSGGLNIVSGTGGDNNWAMVYSGGDQTITGTSDIVLTGGQGGGSFTGEAGTFTSSAHAAWIFGAASYDPFAEGNPPLVQNITANSITITATSGPISSGIYMPTGLQQITTTGTSGNGYGLTVENQGATGLDPFGFGTAAFLTTRTGTQMIEVAEGGVLIKGTGGFAVIDNQGPSQTIDITSGSLTLEAGAAGASVYFANGTSQSITADSISLTGGTNTGALAIIEAADGTQDITARTGTLNVIGGNATGPEPNPDVSPTDCGATSACAVVIARNGLQTIDAFGISLTGGGGNVDGDGSENLAVIRGDSGQDITIGAGGLTITGGDGSGVHNFAMIENYGGDQILTFENGGSLSITGGDTGVRNFAGIFGGGSISYDYTVLANTPLAQTFTRTTDGTSSQQIRGNPVITVDGGATGGGGDGTEAQGHSRGNAGFIIAQTGSQQIDATSITMTGGGGLGENEATVAVWEAGASQTINAADMISVTGGSALFATANINSAGAQTISAGGINLIGGTNEFTQAEVSASGIQNITFGNGGLTLDGGTANSDYHWAKIFAGDTQLISGTGDIILTGGVSGFEQSFGEISASNGQDITGKSITITALGGPSSTGLFTFTGLQKITTTGSAANGYGLTIRNLGATGPDQNGASGSGAYISTRNGSELIEVANSRGVLIESSGDFATIYADGVGSTQTINIHGSGANELTILAHSGAADIVGVTQTMTTGQSGEAGLVQLSGGTADGATARIASFGDQSITSRGTISITGGSVPDAEAEISSAGTASVTSTGGSVLLNDALAAIRGDSVSISAGADISLLGGVEALTSDIDLSATAGKVIVGSGTSFSPGTGIVNLNTPTLFLASDFTIPASGWAFDSLGGKTIDGAPSTTLSNLGTLTFSSTTVKTALSNLGAINAFSTNNLIQGALDNQGTMTVKPGGSLVLSGAASNAASGSIVVSANDGAGSSSFSSMTVSGTLNNAGTVELRSDASNGFNASLIVGSTGTVNNSGTIHSMLTGTGASTPTSFINPGGTNGTLVNTGTVRVDSPTTISLTTFDNQGTVIIAAGATSIINAQVNNVGLIDVAQDLTIAGALIIPNTASGTVLTGAGNLVVDGAFTANATGGAVILGGTGTLTTNGVSTTNGQLHLDTRHWDNFGTLTVNSGQLTLDSAAVFTNAASGTVNLVASSNNAPIRQGAGALSTFNNAGTLAKTTVATHVIDTVFNNSGSVTESAGILEFSAGGTHSGLFDATVAGTAIGFTGGNHVFNDGSEFSGAGEIQITGGSAQFDMDLGTASALRVGGAGTSLGGTGSLALDGVTTFGGGTFTIAGGVTTGASSVVTVNNVSTIDGSQWTNAGVVNFTGRIILANGSVLDNLSSGVMTLASSSNNTPVQQGAGSLGTFNNLGVLNKDFDGLHTIETLFTNNGTVNINVDVLQFDNFAVNDGTINVAPGATLSTGGSALLNAATGVIGGNGTLDLGAGVTLTNRGKLRPGASPGALTITGDLVLDGANGSVTEIELGGLIPGTEYDVINVSGTVSGTGVLNDNWGTLNLLHFGGFAAEPGDSFAVMNYGAHVGDFTVRNFPLGHNYTALAGANSYGLGLLSVSNTWIGLTGLWNDGTKWNLGHAPTSFEDALIPDVGLAGISDTITVNSAGQVARSLISQEILAISAGDLALSQASSMSAPVDISGGTLTANAELTLATLDLSAGTLAGTGNALVNGAFDWTGGTVSGLGSFTAASAQFGGGLKQLDGRAITIDGALNFGGVNWLDMSNGAVLTVNGLATLDTSAISSSFFGINSVSGAASTANFLGGITKLGAQPFDLAVQTNTAGIVRSQQGQLAFDAGFTGPGTATHAGTSFVADSGAEVSFSRGTHIVEGNVSFGGAGQTHIWANGTAAQFLPGEGVGTLTNNGSLAVDSDATLGVDLINAGTLTFGDSTVSGNLNNSGTINVSNGTTNLSGGLSSNGTGSEVNINGGTLSGPGAVSASVLNLTSGSLSGTGSLTVTSNFTQTGGNVGDGYQNVDLTHDGNFALTQSYSAANTLSLRATNNGDLIINDVSLSGFDVTLSGNNVTLQPATSSGSQVDASNDLTLTTSTNGVLALDGANGPVKLIAGGDMGIESGTVNVTAGAFAASIDPDTLTISATGNIVLTGGSGTDASATISGNDVTVSGANILLNGGSGANSFAVIEATPGNATVTASNLIIMNPGTGSNADASMVAPPGLLTVTAQSCTGCIVLESDPLLDPGTNQGLFGSTVVLDGGIAEPALPLDQLVPVYNSIIYATTLADSGGEANTEYSEEESESDESANTEGGGNDSKPKKALPACAM